MATKVNDTLIDVRIVINDNPGLCEFLRSDAAHNERNLVQEIKFILKRYVEEIAGERQ